MSQSTSISTARRRQRAAAEVTAANSPAAAVTASNGLHMAIIMDGNGRWAARRGAARSEGHDAGALTVRRVVRAALERHVSVLTLYAFSADNWKRPQTEVSTLMALFGAYLRSEADVLAGEGVRLSIIGSRDGLPEALIREIIRAEVRTAAGSRMRLRVAINYSARDAIRKANAYLAGTEIPTAQDFSRALGWAMNDSEGAPDVDILIRTGGEQRLSDFLIWESAYAELFFTETAWPDFGAEELDRVLDAFQARERRFGALPTP